MLTGDNPRPPSASPLSVGIDECGRNAAEDKMAVVGELARHGVVAMVGDRVNDAPAMVRPTSASPWAPPGTDTAIETADLALMSDDLGKLAWLVDTFPSRPRAVLRQNITFALGVKAVFTLLASRALPPFGAPSPPIWGPRCWWCSTACGC